MFTLRRCLRASLGGQFGSLIRSNQMTASNRKVKAHPQVALLRFLNSDIAKIDEKGVVEDVEISDWSQVDFPRYNALDLVTEENVSVVNHIRPSLKKSFNLAAYVNVSETLQQLLKLGVDLSKLDRHHELASYLVKADFEKDIQPYILFFLRKAGVKIADVPSVINRNPHILMTPIEDLQVRLNYFRFRKFSPAEVASMLVRASNIFGLDTKTLDARLGYLLREYSLTPVQLRGVVNAYPRLLALTPMAVKKVTFTFKEECGFSEQEIREILFQRPIIWRKFYSGQGGPSRGGGHRDLMRVFDYVHQEMAISHELIAKTAGIFSVRLPRIEYRHKYLKFLGRAQYDPTKPLYVPLSAFFEVDDATFCLKYAKTSVHDLNAFLKTL